MNIENLERAQELSRNLKAVRRAMEFYKDNGARVQTAGLDLPLTPATLETVGKLITADLVAIEETLTRALEELGVNVGEDESRETPDFYATTNVIFTGAASDFIASLARAAH